MEILIAPVVSEKATGLAEKSNQYAFKVNLKANKIEIKKAVEAFFGVTVVDVNTMVVMGKRKSRYTKKGFVESKKSNYKKAIVTLKEGDVIDFFNVN
jgi:large subunit ribosomal protein L23